MSLDQLKREAEDYVDEVWDDLLADIDSLVRIESVEDPFNTAPGAPFGPAVAEALDTALSIAEKLGLEPHNLDGYIGYGELAGERPDALATIAHCDIVPIGEGWTFEPLALTVHDGYLIGRGTQDDKGPLVLSLYAAGFFARKAAAGAAPLPYTLHAIVGANEETRMGDVDHYLDACGQPAFLFTPDAEFPLICGEKGIFQGALESIETVGTGALVDVRGGTAPNAVPGSAFAIVKADVATLPAAGNIEVTPEDDGLARIAAKGKGGHASIPEGTVNAIAILDKYLLENVELTPSERSFLEMSLRICSATDGSAEGIACADEVFGALTCVGGVIFIKDGVFTQTVDCRYPTCMTGAGVADALTALGAEYGAAAKKLENKEPFYTDPESAPIKAMLKTYEEYTGREGKAFVIGGGTYARKFARGAAFGPHDDAEPTPDWVGMEHGPDEGISEEAMKRALKIYIVTIARLMELDLS